MDARAADHAPRPGKLAQAATPYGMDWQQLRVTTLSSSRRLSAWPRPSATAIAPLLFEQALVIAENELVLRCVRAEGVAVIERLRDVTAQPLTRRDNSLARAKARFRLVKIKYKQLVQAKAARHKGNNVANPHQQGSRGEQGSGAAQAAGMQKPIRTRDEFDAMRHAMPDLERLARYERRAWSRRKRAIRDFIEIKSRIDG
jgi:hypothetical protein